MQLWPANENAFAAQRGGGVLDVGVGLDDHRRRVPELEVDPLARRALADAPSRPAPEPVNVISATRSSSTRTSPISADGPTSTFSQPGGSPASCSSSARKSAESGVCDRGLEDDGAAGRERGGDLVRDEVEREVERADRADDADRARACVNASLPSPACEASIGTISPASFRASTAAIV